MSLISSGRDVQIELVEVLQYGSLWYLQLNSIAGQKPPVFEVKQQRVKSESKPVEQQQ